MAIRDNLNGNSNVEPYVYKNGYVGIGINYSQTVISAQGGNLNVTYNGESASQNNRYGEGYFGTSDFIDITPVTYILLDRTAKTSGSIPQYGHIYLIDENRAKTEIATLGIPTGFRYQNYIDVSKYSGSYRIGFSANSSTYTYGYGNPTGTLTINALIIY